MPRILWMALRLPDHYSIITLRIMISSAVKPSAKFQRYFEASRPEDLAKTAPPAMACSPEPTGYQEIVDLRSMVSSLERERVSKLERPAFNLQPAHPKPSRRGRETGSWAREEWQMEQEEMPIKRLSNSNTEKEEFLPSYQRQGLAGFLLYLLFVLLLPLELLVTILSLSAGPTTIVSIALTVLCAEAVSESVLRRLVRDKGLSVRERITRLRSIPENWKEKIVKKENAVLFCLVVLATGTYWLYFSVLVRPCRLAPQEEGYLLCDIFCAYVLFPLLLEKFCFTKSFQSRRGKLALFGALLAVLAVLILAASPLLFCLLVSRTGLAYLRLCNSQDGGWIADASTFLLLAGVGILVFLREVVGVGQAAAVLEVALAAGRSVGCITLAMLVGRLGRAHLQRWLLGRHFNEAYINLALLLSALATTVPYCSLPLAMARAGAQAGLAWVVWAEGTESLQVQLGPQNSDYGSL